MTHTRSSPSNASDAQSAPLWTLSEIQQLAEREFPTSFHALPSVRNLTFKSHGTNFEAPERRNRLGIDTTMSLAVGHCDIRTNRAPVFVFVRVFHGQKIPQIIYVYHALDYTGGVHLFNGETSSIKFEEPFCYLSIDTQSSHAINSRLRAVILYYFVAAGHLQRLPRYSSFLQYFQQGCVSIARCITMGKARPASSHQRSEPSPQANTSPSVSKAPIEAQHNSPTISHKRKRVDEENNNTQTLQKLESETHQLRHQNTALTAEIAHLHTQHTTLTTQHHALEAQTTLLTTKTERLHRLQTFHANAYKGLEQRHNDTRLKLAATTKERDAAKATLHELKMGVAKDMANLNQTATSLARESAGLARNAAKMAKETTGLAVRYGIDLTGEKS
ncbi:Nn.00g116920.m01.CDS01 [Neocucurbitaria sp. VM-36]